MTAKHAPDRVEQMTPSVVEIRCSCDWGTTSATWSDALVTLGNHVNSENQAVIRSVANALFHIVHPGSGHYKNQTDLIIADFQALAQHVLDHGYAE